MKRIIKIILFFVVLLAVIAGGGLLWLSGPSDPGFEGKKLSAWLKDTANKNADVRENAKAVLKRMDAKALPALMERLHFVDDAEKQKWAATFGVECDSALSLHLAAIRGIKALGAQAKPLIPELSKLFEDDATNDDAASALAGVGPDAIQPMIALLDSPNPRVRKGAANVLGRNGPQAVAALPGLLKLMKDNDTDVRYFSAVALGSIRADAPHAVPALIAALDDKSGMVVAAAASSLGGFGALAKEALPRLQPLARSPDQAVNGAAKSAIQQIKGETGPQPDSKPKE